MSIELPVIVSASAGAGVGRSLESSLRSLLTPRFGPRFLHPTDREDLRRLVGEVAQSGTPCLAVAGGDGTLHLVVNALGDATVIVAPLPTGSGNDFCRGVGLTRLDTAVAALASGRTRRVDLVEVNGTRVCTVAGLGIVADTGVQIGRLLAPGSPWRGPGRALGDMSYLAGAAARLLFHPSVAGSARVAWRELDGSCHDASRRLHGIMLANLRTLGAGMRLPVPGTPDDGAFELVEVLEGSRLKLARSLSCLRSDRPVPNGTLHVARVVAARIEWEGGSRLLGDGEDLGSATVFTARILPSALEIPTP